MLANLFLAMSDRCLCMFGKYPVLNICASEGALRYFTDSIPEWAALLTSCEVINLPLPPTLRGWDSLPLQPPPRIISPTPVDGPNVFTDATKNKRAAFYVPQKQILRVFTTEYTSAQKNELLAVTRALAYLADVPVNLITDSLYCATALRELPTAFINPCVSTIASLLADLQNLLLSRHCPVFVLHVRSHVSTIGPIYSGNDTVDRALLCPLLSEAHQAHDKYHLSARSLRHLYGITKDQARDIVKRCLGCAPFRPPHIDCAINPRGDRPNALWQMDVTHYGKTLIHVAERCENKNYLLDEICGLKEEEVATIKVELEGDKFKDKQKENVQNQGKVLESDFMLEFNDLINQLNESSENQLKLQKSHQKLFNELISFTEELMCKDGHETGKREIKDLPLKVVVSKCKQLESKGQNHQELLIAIKNAQEKYDKLKKRRRELKEEVINLKQQIEMYKVKPGHLEEFKRELKEQTRQKILENLKPINLFLQWQATYQENLDQLRENHSAFMTNQEFQIRDLKLELSKLKNSLQEPQAATERFREFHISDKLNSHRTIEGLASENAKLHYEIPKNEKMHTSIGFTCPIQEPFHVENLNHEVTYNRSRLLRENLGYSTKKTASSKSQMEGYFLKMQQEFHKNLTKGLNETKAELESSSGTSSPLLSLEESSDFEALASRATREYTEVLKKRFMI
ncbi:uncharacterized protein LOC141512244 [Macrotis lagotis]|uniref:uncharacterized protein LOC141512244 n=1 Tax=Macrotis lagotis TaxID=92651 RepID=UPI003D697BD3